MKKIFALIIAAMFLVTIPANAQDTEQTVRNANVTAETFYASLPTSKGNYKSRQRPILIEGAMNSETEILVRALKNPVAYRELN